MKPEEAKPAEIIGEMIETARLRKDLPVRALARQIKVTHSYVRDMILGRRLPSEAIILRLCEELELDCDEMMMIAGRVSKSVYQHVQLSKEYGIFIRQLADKQVTDEEIKLLSGRFQDILDKRNSETRTRLLERKQEQDKPLNCE